MDLFAVRFVGILCIYYFFYQECILVYIDEDFELDLFWNKYMYMNMMNKY